MIHSEFIIDLIHLLLLLVEGAEVDDFAVIFSTEIELNSLVVLFVFLLLVIEFDLDLLDLSVTVNAKAHLDKFLKWLSQVHWVLNKEA